MSNNVHVVPSDGGWDVKVEGSPGATHFPTQSEAIQVGRQLAHGNRSEHIIPG